MRCDPRAPPGRAAARIGEHVAQDGGQALGVARRDVAAREPVHDRVDEAAHRAGDHGHAAGHRLERRDAEGLVPGDRHQRVRGAQEHGELLAGDAPAEVHAVGDAGRLGERAQAPRLGVRVELGPRRPAGDDELAPRHVGQGADDVPDPLALDQPARVDDAVRQRSLLAQPVGAEALQVDTAGDDVDLRAVRAQAHELERLVRARRHDAIHPGDDVALELRALRRARVRIALVAALDDPERVEGVDDREAQALRGPRRREAGHPEVAVDDVRPVAAPLALELVGERVHVPEQLVLRQHARRAGVDVVDLDPGVERHAPRRRGVVAPRVDDDLGAPRRQPPGERGDVDVLAPGVDAPEDRQRASVLRDQGDAHPTPPPP